MGSLYPHNTERERERGRGWDPVRKGKEITWRRAMLHCKNGGRKQNESLSDIIKLLINAPWNTSF